MLVHGKPCLIPIIKSTHLPESKVKDIWIVPLPMQNAYLKTFLDVKFLFVNRFSRFLRHILGLKEY